MKKIVTITLISLFSLVVISCFAIFAIAGFSFKNLGIGVKYNLINNQEVFNANDNMLVVDVSASNVVVTFNKDNEFKFSYYENENIKYTITKEQGVITLFDNKYSKPWYNAFDDFYDDMQTLIEIPKDFDGTVTVKNKVGDIEFKNIFSMNLLSISAETEVGDISLNGGFSNDLTFTTTIGDIEVENFAVENNVNVTSTLGDVSFSDFEAIGVANVSITSGDLEIDDSSFANLKISSTNGDIDFENLSITNLDIQTVNGDIEGFITGSESSYNISANSEKGRCNLKNSINDGGSKSIKIQTKRGKIKVLFR